MLDWEDVIKTMEDVQIKHLKDHQAEKIEEDEVDTRKKQEEEISTKLEFWKQRAR